MSAKNSIAEYRELIYALPQGVVLQSKDVERWLAGMIARVDALSEQAPALLRNRSADDEIRWHIRRAGGIGSSESGTSLLHERKQYWMDVSLPRLVDQKLFKALPDESNHHMQRGTLLEPVARRLFQNVYGAQTDDIARAAMRTFAGWPAHPWLVGEEDDIVQIGQRRFLVDYKFTEHPMDDVPLMYKAQLHHLWTKGRLAGVKFDGLLLAAATMPGAQILVDAVKHDPAMIEPALAMADALSHSRDTETRVKAFRVDFSLDFAKDLIRANQRVWDEHVMTGTRPRFFRRERAALSDDQQREGAVVAERYARLKAMSDHASEAAKSESARLVALVEGTDFGNKKQPFPLLSISQRDNMDLAAAHEALRGQGLQDADLCSEGVFDIKKLAAAAERAGVDMDACRAPGKPDKKKISKALDTAGLEADEFISPSLAVGLTRASKGPGIEQLNTIRSAAVHESALFMEKDFSLPESATPTLETAPDSSAGAPGPAPAPTDLPDPPTEKQSTFQLQ